MIVTGTTHVIA
jgi:hypothetical protein